MYDLVKERKKKQKKLDDYVFGGFNMYVSSRKNSRSFNQKKTFKLKAQKDESDDQDKVDDKQEKLTAEDTLISSKNIAKPKRKYTFKNKYKQMKKIQNEKDRKKRETKKAEKQIVKEEPSCSPIIEQAGPTEKQKADAVALLFQRQ